MNDDLIHIIEVSSSDTFLRRKFFIDIEGEDDFGQRIVRRIEIPRMLAKYIWDLHAEVRQLRTEKTP